MVNAVIQQRRTDEEQGRVPEKSEQEQEQVEEQEPQQDAEQKQRRVFVRNRRPSWPRGASRAQDMVTRRHSDQETSNRQPCLRLATRARVSCVFFGCLRHQPSFVDVKRWPGFRDLTFELPLELLRPHAAWLGAW